MSDVALETGRWNGDVVLSSEVFQNVQRPDRISQLIDPADCDVVIYLRERYGYAQSSYAQVVHAQRWSGTFTEYLDVFETDYVAFLRRWEGWSPARLCVRPFARSALVAGDVIVDFAVAAEIPPDILVASPHDANPSLGGALLEFKRVLNSMPRAEASGPGYNVLSRVARTDPSFRIRPQALPEVTRAYRRRFADTLAELTGRYPQLAVLNASEQAAPPTEFNLGDFRVVWAAIEAESPAYAAGCRAVFHAERANDPMVRLIADAAN